MEKNVKPEYEKLLKYKSFIKLQRISLIIISVVFLINITTVILGLASSKLYIDTIAYLNVFTRFIQATVFIILAAFQIYCVVSDRASKEKSISVAPTVIFVILTIANTFATHVIYNFLSNGF